ncbi:RHOMBOID-like protein 10, chloroplastic isoform X1 [Eucalyptus grandis]|uniref:RHOMBOID-like protein 10, chloroplastic isoform X1 n=1 Tax=Eucalyptus grandis TaxID=71139 RepID=UPI0008A0D9F5|nr:RHOMBOID-like protein 10, chloroplastic isoform X1 [Eucalyptus grandis]
MLGLSANPTPPYYHRHPQFRRLRMSIAGGFSGPAAVHLIAGAASLRLRHHLCCLISSSLQSLKDIWYQRALSFNGVEYLQLSKDAFSFSCSSFFHFPDGREGKTDGTSSSETSRRKSSNGRHWTNVILAVNIFFAFLFLRVYAVQLATQGKLLSWGAKINHLIDKGQWWRLATSSLLHANAMHLMVNCYSLNSIGPTVEAISGPKKYLMVYATSAITSSAMSYWLNKASSVGASGAIFGLVGYMAVYITRHRALIKDANEGLKHIAKVIILNMVIGLSSKGIDNWGHVGGFLGGVVTPWLLDPAWKLERRSGHGRRSITDIKGRKDPRQPK